MPKNDINNIKITMHRKNKKQKKKNPNKSLSDKTISKGEWAEIIC